VTHVFPMARTKTETTRPRAPATLVTGSSRGLGRGIAVELARGGYSVAIHYSGNLEAARETVALCEDAAAEAAGVPSVTSAAGLKGREAQRFAIFQCDIADSSQRSRLVAEVFAAFGTIDALVNNAGMGPRLRADILDAGEDSFEELLRTNAQGPYFLTQAVARRWLADGSPPALADGRAVVFVTSISAETASTNRGDYCVSKAALSMACRLWAARLAGEGIRVYELRPGLMLTDMTAGVKGKYDELIGRGVVPQGRWGTPEDVGRGVRSLLDGDFPFSTGSVIHMDGGLNIPRL
jgi:3-oxoacyl-[acyl-carrier protein] reductase